jgi:hypothetical protein
MEELTRKRWWRPPLFWPPIKLRRCYDAHAEKELIGEVRNSSM